jgi:hypothetical protein
MFSAMAEEERNKADEPEAADAEGSATDEVEQGVDEEHPHLKREKAGISGPSIGPDTIIEREPPEDRLARHEQSEVDAMGKDKRRDVVGQSYGPSKTRQLTLYGIALAVIAVLAIGGKLLADELDQPPDTIEPKAPWAEQDARQIPPKPLQ